MKLFETSRDVFEIIPIMHSNNVFLSGPKSAEVIKGRRKERSLGGLARMPRKATELN